MMRFLLLLGVAFIVPSASAPQAQTAPVVQPAPAPGAESVSAARPVAVPVLTATVVARYPHDVRAFTEGLIWRDGALYESIGYERQSEVRRVRLSDGKVVARVAIPATQFGEGLAAWKDELVSLTWHDGIAHRWNARTLKPVGENRYTGEGWGLASDGRSLILGDGSATLRFLDPVSFAERRRIGVHLPDGRAVDQVNELEVVDGAILANVWHTRFLLRIDSADGRITGIADLGALVAEVHAANPEAVLNGIAWDPVGKRLFVTGKLWPTVFEVKLTPAG